MKLYLDEHLSQKVAQQLRKQGYDVICAHEANMDGCKDEEQMEYAAANKRCLVTYNIGDFIRIHLQWLNTSKNHYGILLISSKSIHQAAIAAQVKTLAKYLNDHKKLEALKNNIDWLSP